MSLLDTIAPLGRHEFTHTDKLQPDDYVRSRAQSFHKLYALDPNLAREVISHVYPHPAGRPWADSEIRKQLDLPSVKLAFEALASAFPSLSKAFDAYREERTRQDYARFPALHATQPEMKYYSSQT